MGNTFAEGGERMQKPWSYHDEIARRKWQGPEAILTETGLRSGFTFVDVGCGQGFFTLPAARMAGPDGKVYASDINAEAIKLLKAKAAEQGLKNILATVDEAEGYIPCRGAADVVFFGIVLHDFRDPASVLVNARKMLKPAGSLVNLDWKKEHFAIGPPFEKRFDEEKAAALITEAGFSIASVKDSGPHHYMIIARPI
jgi:2-polyprenyl-3-methyl-5-hydroxy-6-metoxy-1,4-benzoquinol methylase